MVEDSVLDSEDFQSMRPLGYRIMAVIIGGNNALRTATSVLWQTRLIAGNRKCVNK